MGRATVIMSGNVGMRTGVVRLGAQSGTKFRMVANYRRRDRTTGDWVDGAEFWVEVVCWGPLATGVQDSVRTRRPGAGHRPHRDHLLGQGRAEALQGPVGGVGGRSRPVQGHQQLPAVEPSRRGRRSGQPGSGRAGRATRWTSRRPTSQRPSIVGWCADRLTAPSCRAARAGYRVRQTMEVRAAADDGRGPIVAARKVSGDQWLSSSTP